MKGEWISVAAEDGRAFAAYTSAPPKGSGPGLLVCHDVSGIGADMLALADLMAEEGYTVLMPDLLGRPDPRAELACIEAAGRALRQCPSFKGRVGIVGFGIGGRLAVTGAAACGADCAVSYYGEGIDSAIESIGKEGVATVLHFAEKDSLVPAEAIARISQRKDVELYVYRDVERGFASKDSPAYRKSAADMAYTRTLALLRKVLGPHFDLSALWERHRACEFELRDADATMRTMVEEPYVNHIPTMTGGFGQTDLHRFYKEHFIPKSPKDMRNIPVSRTVGADRVVNEGVLCFTHDVEIDWMLPGIPPTGRYVEVPIVGIITFRGDKLAHEHIYWDQASVLVQIGLLDPAGLPVAGIETAKKVLDPSRPSNALLTRRNALPHRARRKARPYR